MNDSAFSCGRRPAVEQPLGNAPLELDVDDPCMSENTTLPQRSWTGASFGVVNWKFNGIACRSLRVRIAIVAASATICSSSSAPSSY